MMSFLIETNLSFALFTFLSKHICSKVFLMLNREENQMHYHEFLACLPLYHPSYHKHTWKIPRGIMIYQFPLHLVLKKTITHNNFSTCAFLFLDFLHLKIVSYSCTPLLYIMWILCAYYAHIGN